MDKNIEYLLHKLEMECSDIDTIREDIKDTYEEFDSKLIELKENILSDADDLIKEYKKVLEEKAEKSDTEKEDTVDQYKDIIEKGIEKRRERFHTLCERVLVDQDQEPLYNFDPDKLLPRDTVFGIVMNLEHANRPQYRFPFRIVEVDYSHNIIKMIGLRPAGIETYKFEDAVKLSWDIAFIINHELVHLKNCSILDATNVNDLQIFALDYSNNIKKNPILAIGVPYWFFIFPIDCERCSIVKPDGVPASQNHNESSFAVPFVRISGKLHHRSVNDMPTI